MFSVFLVRLIAGILVASCVSFWGCMFFFFVRSCVVSYSIWDWMSRVLFLFFALLIVFVVVCALERAIAGGLFGVLHCSG